MRTIYRLCLLALLCVLPSAASAAGAVTVTFHNNFIYDSHGDPQGTGRLEPEDLRYAGIFYAFIYRDGELVKFAHFVDRQIMSVTTVERDGLATTLATKSADDLPIQLVVQYRRTLAERMEPCPATAIERQETTTYFYGDEGQTSSMVVDRMETDSCGRILARETTLQDGESGGRLEYGYEEVGGITVMVSMRPVSSDASAVFVYYDTEGRFVRSLNYDIDGTLMGEERQYYDEYGRVQSHMALDPDGGMIYVRDYEYDDRGMLINTTELMPMVETDPAVTQDGMIETSTEAAPLEEADSAE